MKKLLYLLLLTPIILLTSCSKSDLTPQTMEDAVVGKRWIANNANDGFYLSEEGGLYTIYKCGEDVLLGDWIIEEDKIKYRYYENSLEITTLFCVVSEYTATQIKVVDSSNPTTTINIIYNVYTEVYGCMDEMAYNYNPNANCWDENECIYCLVYGCMDLQADNYNPNADCDDGSCYYATYVPDNNFEAYLEANGMGNGIPNDDYVNAANINTVTYLNVNDQNIADLTGIEAFTDLSYLYCEENQLTSLNVSQNTALSYLYCAYNQLTSLDVSQNTALSYLICRYNQLTSLNVSQNTALTNLRCTNNQLTSLDVRNGNNTNFTDFYAFGNPNLYCIDVDDATWSTANWTVANWNIDSQSYFSNNCGSK